MSIRKRHDRKSSTRLQPLQIVSELPEKLSPVTVEPMPSAVPSNLTSEADLLGPPNLPDIVLSPTPISRNPLSAVYLGRDRAHRCDVIVKVHRLSNDSVSMDRFRREAAVMARLRHPSIVSLYRFYEGDPAALVMEYVRGQTLAALVKADGWLSSSRVATIIDSIAAALDSAHAENIIHRDVKPANILLTKRGPARLTDFGVAHIDEDAPLTVMGDMLGTIEYASPEQVRGHETPDARSDVYSLAAVTYFALTGTPPFRAADESTQAQLSVMHRQVFTDPPPLRFHREDISPKVEAVVLRGLAKLPDERYQSAGHFAAALHAAVEEELGTPEQNALAAASRRTGTFAGVAAAAALLLLGGGLWWNFAHHRLPEAPQNNIVNRAVPLHAPPAPVAVPPPAPKPAPTVMKPVPTPAPVEVKRVKAIKKPTMTVLIPKAVISVPSPRQTPFTSISQPIAIQTAKPTESTLEMVIKRLQKAQGSKAVLPIQAPIMLSHPFVPKPKVVKYALPSHSMPPTHIRNLPVVPAIADVPTHVATPSPPVVLLPATSKGSDDLPPPHLRNP